jgi:hypothetical protein
MCLRTVRGIKENLRWPNLGFILVDDGSGQEYVDRVVEEIGVTNHLWVYQSNHKGVGHNMNVGLQHIFDLGGELLMLLEDDWELTTPLDLTPYVNVVLNNDVGLIRMGYLNVGLRAELVSHENMLWWQLERKPEVQQYTYTGHAGLRHKRLFDRVGMFSEGLSPGQNELDYCSKYNYAQNPPAILWPAEWGVWGKFEHIGGDSLSSIVPGGGG